MHLNQAELTQQDKQKYSITGVIDFSTVPGLVRKTAEICKSAGRSVKGASSAALESVALEIDLSEVTESNSAALALILEIAKDARANNITLHFQNLPESLHSIAKAYGIESEIRELCK